MSDPSSNIQRQLLEALEQNPDATQAGLAAQLGVAVGSVNWYLKRLVRKGYVKVTRLQRRKLKYFVTPEGLAVKAQLTSKYLKSSLRVYRELRQAAHTVLAEVQAAGYTALCLPSPDEIGEIFRLTCFEQGIQAMAELDDKLPVVIVEGASFTIRWPEQEKTQGVKSGGQCE